MLDTENPGPRNGYQGDHAALLIKSFRRWTGKDLVQPKSTCRDLCQILFEAPFAVVSHNTDPDPLFNYGNKAALALFEMDWPAFTRLPSRQSAEPVNQDERQSLLARVSQFGFIDDYRGIRISATGKRFRIDDAVVWNLVDEDGNYSGQAAVLYRWTPL